jgi:hypothetical protein
VKSFVSKPVHILGKQFDGSRESAQEITAWVKAVIVDDTYRCAELKESVSQWGFLDTPISEESVNVLVISTDKNTFYINKTDWIVQFADSRKFQTYMNDRLLEIYKEL